jgi:hypothetical protein
MVPQKQTQSESLAVRQTLRSLLEYPVCQSLLNRVNELLNCRITAHIGDANLAPETQPVHRSTSTNSDVSLARSERTSREVHNQAGERLPLHLVNGDRPCGRQRKLLIRTDLLQYDLPTSAVQLVLLLGPLRFGHLEGCLFSKFIRDL